MRVAKFSELEDGQLFRSYSDALVYRKVGDKEATIVARFLNFEDEEAVEPLSAVSDEVNIMEPERNYVPSIIYTLCDSCSKPLPARKQFKRGKV